MTDIRHYAAGHVLSAAEALTDGRETYSSAQVACLVSLAYQSGRDAGYSDDMAEMVTLWWLHKPDRTSYEERVAARVAEMEQAAELTRLRAGLPRREPYRGGPVEWDDNDPPKYQLTARDKQNLAMAAKTAPVGNQAQPGTREYAEGWRQMRSRLTPWQWHCLTTGDNPPLGPRTLAAIRELDRADQAQGQRHLHLVKNGGAA